MNLAPPRHGHNPIAAAIFHPDNHGNASVILPGLPTGIPPRDLPSRSRTTAARRPPPCPYVLAGN